MEMDQDIAKLWDRLHGKIKVLNETIWEDNIREKKIKKWLENFKDSQEQLHMLYLLSNFMYFGGHQMRILLKSLFRDFYRYPVIKRIRQENGNTLDANLIKRLFSERLKNTRFLGMGNPSESGTHLLYFLRQENDLPKRLFMDSYNIFSRHTNSKGAISIEGLKDPTIKHYVFIDDFCASGTQAKEYSKDILSIIKKFNPKVNASYITLFATKTGIENVKNCTDFDEVDAVQVLDESFKVFSTSSRYFKNCPDGLSLDDAKATCENHGYKLIEQSVSHLEPNDIKFIANRDKLGYKDSQLLIGFYHNTPDNTLPVVWYGDKENDWYPIFKRYNKKYGFN